MWRNKFILDATERALQKVRTELATCSIEDPVAVLIEYSDPPPVITAMLRAGADKAALKAAALAAFRSGKMPPRRLKPALYPRKGCPIGRRLVVEGITFSVPHGIAKATSRALLDFDGEGFHLTSEDGVLLMPAEPGTDQRQHQ